MRKKFKLLSLATFGLLNLILFGAACNSGNKTPPVTPTNVTPSQFVTQLVADANNGTVSSSF
jgi:hypothetical protein